MTVKSILCGGAAGLTLLLAAAAWAETSVEASTAPVAIPSAALPPATTSAIDNRLQYERFARQNPFVLTPYRENYILPAAYNVHPNNAGFDTGNPGGELQNVEVKFQISVKVNLVRELIYNRADLFVAYTQRSFWQAYNTENSSPFRETNYEPEAGLTLYNDVHFLGLRNRIATLTVSHQSNGRGGTQSRSWNRVSGQFLFQRDNFYIGLRPWYRLPESAATDDNPDIETYMGYGELTLNYVVREMAFGVLARDNFKSDNKGAVQVDWSFPLINQFKGYIQYFYGYGESLIDYNHLNQGIGLGLILTNRI